MYVHFTPLGGKLSNTEVHPIFTIDRMFPAKFFHLILSDEVNSPEQKSVDENIADIEAVLKVQGVGFDRNYFVLENFWKNVGSITEMILSTEVEDQIILNISTGRRVFVSTLVLAGSLAMGWMPEKKVVCVQASGNYDKVVIFEPNLPMVPDKYDRIILNEIQQNDRKTTTSLSKQLNKGQSTVSVRIKKLSEAGFIESTGHSKVLLPKGKELLVTMNNLAEKRFNIFK